MSAPLNILVVEDNDELREATVESLRDQGHRVTGVDCAEAVPEHLGEIDLMVVDLNLPGEDGISLSRHIRSVQPEIGLIMVTARQRAEDKKRGYESGADIYLPKPVGFEELRAAIAALARRLHPERASAQRLLLQPTRFVLTGAAGQELILSAPECTLLTALIRAQDHRLENWQLIEILSKDGSQDPKSALELQVVRLRKKLLLAGAAQPTIQSVRGWGYQLCVPIRLASAA